MVTKYGMSDDIGPVALEGAAGKTLFGSAGVESKEFSEKVSEKIDSEVKRIIHEAYKKAEDILTEKRVVLDAIAAKLLETETLEREQYEALLTEHGIKVKEKDPMNLADPSKELERSAEEGNPST
jgi:cell division protease FtsH